MVQAAAISTSRFTISEQMVQYTSVNSNEPGAKSMGLTERISFNRIAPRNGSQDDAFEEFCCQIARRTPDVPPGSEFIRYRGAGGDGGVECVYRLPNGDEWGWQAKYVFDFAQAISKAEESFRTAIAVHPRLTRYTVCLPFDLTGPTGRKGRGGRPAKSQREVFDERRVRWVTDAKAAGVSLKVDLETPSTLLDGLQSFDPQGGRLLFWFDETILSREWFEEQLKSAIRTAGPRYTPKLNVNTPLSRSFEAFGLTEEWYDSIVSFCGKARKLLESWRENVARTIEASWSGAPFPEALKSSGKIAEHALSELQDLIESSIKLRQTTVDPSLVASKTEAVLSEFREVRIQLAANLDSKYGEGSADSASFRQFQAEHLCCFPASNVDSADEIIKFLEEFAALVCSPTASLPHARFFVLAGVAGVGKTHAICDAAAGRLKRGLRTLTLFGERFTDASEPWVQVRQMLGFDGSLARDAMLATLDAAGEASGKPLLICIDGLNERLPRDYWRKHLPSMTVDVERFDWLKLCVSCRSSYESQVLPEQLPGVRIVHDGFAGIEFDACQAFFEHHELEPPVAPVLQPEFANPLFLHLVCEAMVAANLKRLPIGWHGISGAMKALIREKNTSFAAQKATLPNHRYPERALMAFVGELERRRVGALPLSIADEVIESVVCQPNLRGVLTEWLVGEGLLIVDAAPASALAAAEDLVRIAFDRLGDHLLAAKYLDGLDAKAIRTAFDSGGALSFVTEEASALSTNAGLVEAFAVQIPERFGVELPECYRGDSQVERRLVEITVTTLPWRDPAQISEATCRIIERSLRLPGFSKFAFDAVLSVAALPSPADASWLHGILAGPSMSQRDEFWCGYLHKEFDEGRGPVAKLIKSAFLVSPEQVPKEVAKHWALTLLWFCAAADRRVRDFATKALVRITEPTPQLWVGLISKLADIDDEYVVERGLAAAYGTLLRTRDSASEASGAAVVYQFVFADYSKFQNAMIRDYARSILELAAQDGALPAGIDGSRYLPPYDSEWPLQVPNKQYMERFKDSYRELPRLYSSCTDDDFYTYTLNSISEYEREFSRPRMGRWIFREVLEMGYGSEMHVNYDGYMLYRFGGGRGRPEWAERIGKKYQRIALSNLAARLSDHIEPRRDRWDEPPRCTPLSYAGGRDIDPSLLLREQPDSDSPAWWLPEVYEFSAVSGLSDREWSDRHDDLPSSESLLSERLGLDGARWMALEAYPKWKEARDEESRSYRLLWFNIQSYLVPQTKAEACWDWLSTKSFMGGWMPEGRQYHEGFVGEYPWATQFNLYEECFETRFGHEKLPCEFLPTCNSLSVGRDSFQSSINFHLPARRFFEDGDLKWDGSSGYKAKDGRLRFLDPSVLEPGFRAMLVDPDHLHDFIKRKKLAVVWTVLGEKLRVGNNAAPRLVYSRVHMLRGRKMRVSSPVLGK